MDKYEYNLKMDQMKSLMADGNYPEAVKIADTINWRKIKNVTALVRAGEVYEQAGRYEESREIFLLAYGRSPLGRTIIYHLICVAIKMQNFDEAREYYREFVEVAPHDNLKYILKYEINKAEGADYKTLIENLEELKEQEFFEEWGYELAYLYHLAGMGDKCVEVCDELVLYFGQGPHVEQALELKMLYQPLSPQQEEKYKQFCLQKEGLIEIHPRMEVELTESESETDSFEENVFNQAVFEEKILNENIFEEAEWNQAALEEEVSDIFGAEEAEIPNVQMSPERFNTQNLQAALQESMQKIMDSSEKEAVKPSGNETLFVNENQKLPETKQEQPFLYSNFQGILNEECDGQMRVFAPEQEGTVQQITGQLDLDDILKEWEKKKQEEAEKKRLEDAKRKALQEAGDIMERLADVIPKLDSELKPQDLKKQYLTEAGEDEAAAARMVANMNQLLQKEIDRLSLEHTAEEVPLAAKEEEFVLEPEEEEAEVQEETVIQPELIEEESLPNVELFLEDINEPKEEASLLMTKELPKIEFPKIEFPNVELSTIELPEIELPEIELPSDINLEVSITALSEEQKELFSFFLPVKGMEEQICTALSSIASRLKNGGNAGSGNLLVQGSSGSGKTVFATNFIKTLQEMTGKLEGRVGKIQAETLNKKEISTVFEKVAGGSLIIENAGKLSEEAVKNLNVAMEEDVDGTLVVLEDTKYAIEKILLRNRAFAFKFDTQVNIPIFTNDELVKFGKYYAKENGYRIDEMGVLALYNSISNIEKAERATTISEVKEIVDEAIAHVERGAVKKALSILTASRFDDEDYIILHEKDFNL